MLSILRLGEVRYDARTTGQAVRVMARHGRNIKALSLKIGQKNEDFAWVWARRAQTQAKSEVFLSYF